MPAQEGAAAFSRRQACFPLGFGRLVRVVLGAGALFPLQAAAAGAWVVAAYLHRLFHGLLFGGGRVARACLARGLCHLLALGLLVGL